MVALDRDFGHADERSGHARAFGLSDADRRFLICVLGALILIRLLLIFWLPVIDSTEARYIEIARKMLVSNDWITPQFDYGVPFWGKPPLHTWLSALGMKLFGVGYFGARILIFATSILTVAVIYDWTRRNRGKDQALVAITVLSSSLLFFGASAFVMTDMVMVLGTTLSMVAFYKCACATGARRLWGHLFFVGLAIGLMAKGPTAVVLTAIPIFLWLLVGHRWHLLSRLPWSTGLILAAILTVPWYVAAEIKTPGFLRYFIIGEHIERFLVPGWSGDLYGAGHARPKGMIWVYGLGVFLPWTIFAAALGVRGNRVVDVFQGDQNGWYSYLAMWMLSPLILFTPAANILPAYALPGIPAAAILLTGLWVEVWRCPRRVAQIAVGAALVASSILYLAVACVAHVAPERLISKSELMLVERAREFDPDMKLTYWGGRSYSAEFYTRGTAQATTRAQDLQALLTNGQRDSIAVSSTALSEVRAIVGARFRDLGVFGRRHLLVEIPADGEHT